MASNQSLKQWFLKLSHKHKTQLTIACKWYAFHLDSYINSIYRNKPYPRKVLKRHAKELFDIDNHTLWTELFYQTFDNEFCSKELINSPFEMFINRSPILLSEFIEQINKTTYFIHSWFTKVYFTLSKPMTVFKGFHLLREEKLCLDLIGASSVATEINSALQFAFSIHGEDDEGNPIFYDERKYKSIVAEITLPIGTLVIPLNICTIQEENELVVITQGTLNTISERIIQENMWNTYINKYGQKVEAGSGRVKYLFIKTQFNKTDDFPKFGNFQITQDHDHVIDDVY